MKKINILILILIILSFIIAGYAYQTIPGEKVASHWNSGGEVDGYMSKFWGLFLFPIILIVMYLLFLAIPKIDPLKKNFEKFRKYYDSFVFLLILFLFYVFILTILANLGYGFNMTKTIIPAVGLLFIYIGIILPHLKRNWFMGIRTPWTISNEEVWTKTHILGGKLFMIAGVIVVIGAFFQQYLLWFILVPALLAAFIPIVYSYIIYRKVKG